MPLHLDLSHTPRWLRLCLRPGQVHFNRAMTIVLGIIVVSFLFSALQVVDVAVSGALTQFRAAPSHPASVAHDVRIDGSEGREATAVDTLLIEVPSASADAISL